MSVAGVVLGRVVEFEQGVPWRVVFPDIEHAGASGYLRELAVSDCSPATLRSYAYDLLRWFRFLHDRWTAWERAERADVREFVELLREAQVPQRLNRRRDASPPGSVNPVTGKATLGSTYAARTINHQLSVLFGFYEWACASGLGPLMNPVPAQRHVGVRPAPPIPVVSPRRSSDPLLGPCRDPFRDRLGGLDVQEVTDVGDDLPRVRGGETMSVVDLLGEDAAVVGAMELQHGHRDRLG